MRCKNCDSIIPDGKLECPYCGAEVILVPEYLSADMEREQQRRELEEQERYLREREERREQRRRERQMKPAVKVLCAALIAALSVAMSAAAISLIRKNAADHFGYYTEVTESVQEEAEQE